MTILAICILASAVAAPLRPEQPVTGTVPMTLEMQSPVVTLTLRTKSGVKRPVRFLVDTGGGGLLLTESVASGLGLEVKRDQAQSEEGMRFAPMETPGISIEGFILDLEGARCAAVLDQTTAFTGTTAEGFLPGHVLRRHHVVFDYPGGKFTMARPGALEPRGDAVTSAVHAQSGFPRIELEVGGERLGFLLDTGASFTMISVDVLEKWKAADEGLPWMTGAVGEANMIGGPMETEALLMRVPTLKWGSFALEDVAAVARRSGTFEGWMSSMMTEPIVGAVGGNVLKHFRVEIDYANGKTYLESKAKDFGTVLDCVGLVLGNAEDGRHRVDAIARVDGKTLCDGIQVGDIVEGIDGKSLEGMTHREVIGLLSGKPGTERKLDLERDGKAMGQTVRVIRLLEREKVR